MTELRHRIAELLRAELVGPSHQLPGSQTGIGETMRGEEILRAEDPPRARYSAGILFPRRAVVSLQATAAVEETPLPTESPEGDDADISNGSSPAGESPAAIEGDPTAYVEVLDSATDLEINRASDYLPSVMGVTALFHLPAELTVEVSAAEYRKIDMPGRGWRRKDGTRANEFGWNRVPISATVKVPCDLFSPSRATVEREVPGCKGLFVHCYSRASHLATHENERIVTVSLINRREASGDKVENEDCFYQCSIRISGSEDEACISEYPDAIAVGAEDVEASNLRLLYRHRRNFGMGHGCAVQWGEPEGGRVSWIASDVLPMFDVKPIVPTRLEGIDLSMVALSGETSRRGYEVAAQLAERYRAWIDERQAELNRLNLPPDLRAAAEDNLASCSACCARIADSADLLKRDMQVRSAFGLMNAAMLMQQVHYSISSQQARGWALTGASRRELRPEKSFPQPSYDDTSRAWRPFQLAFILMNLRSIAQPDSADRNTVDVIWFPTGGGKTEAYLGLTAFTILLRRLRRPANAGTAVLMRYTLRLLTTQQFQRAASLVCAMEYLRRRNLQALGEKRITIGLWVGSAVTPNTEQEARAKLAALQRGDDDNPFILRTCPWCGLQMGPMRDGRATRVKGYRELANPARVRFLCEDPACEFNDGEGLPVQVVDESLYGEPPALVVGTVDKFALIPWKPECRSIFGYGTEDVSPPELIIQDELHLISGPLGSMVGHYEMLIDLLCTDRNGVPAKIVASTATIARARDQVQAVYARSSLQLFPPQALRAGDSFFAREDSDVPGRLYAGEKCAAPNLG